MPTRIELLSSLLRAIPSQLPKAFGPLGQGVSQLPGMMQGQAQLSQAVVKGLAPFIPQEAMAGGVGFGQQIVAEETEKAVRSGIKKQTEQLLAQGVLPEDMLSQIQSFLPQQTSQQVEAGNPNAIAVNPGQDGKTEYGVRNNNIQPAQPNQPQLNQALAGQPQQPQQQQQNQQSNYQNPFGDKPVDQISNFLQTILTIGTGGIIPTPGYLKGSAINEANRASAVGDVEVQKEIKKAQLVPPSQAQLLSAQTELSKTLTGNIISQENKLSDDFNEVSEDFRKVAGSYDILRNLINDGNKSPNGATDLSAAYEFIKFNDPNAVKEGELRTLKEAIPFLSKFGIRAGKLVNGQMFDNETRNKILQAATSKYNTLVKNQNVITERYSEKIKKYGGDPNRALVNPGISKKGEANGFNKTSSGNSFRRVS